MRESELERIERRLIDVEGKLVKVEAALCGITALLGRALDLLETPTTYPQSTGGTITVK